MNNCHHSHPASNGQIRCWPLTTGRYPEGMLITACPERCADYTPSPGIVWWTLSFRPVFKKTRGRDWDAGE